MAITLKIDAFDFTPFIRLQPGDEFNPGANPLEPMFLEAAGGEGQPLIGFSRPNKPMTWPLHVTPTKTADADTKDGLHSLVQQINAVCRDASRVEWRDDSATFSTFWDVVAAKFEPDHSYWKARKLWLSGTLKVWTSTYGDTGTTRILGTAAASAAGVAVTATGIAGDTEAHLDVRMQVGSQVPNDGRIVGVSVVPSGYQWSWGPASMTLRNAFATVMTATNSEASLVLEQIPASAALDTEPTESFTVILPTPSVYAGRNRIIAVAAENRSVTNESMRLRARINGVALSAERIATVSDLDGYGALDLGILSVSGNEATLALNVEARGHTGRVSRVIIVPDELSAISVDTPRKSLASLEPASSAETLITQDNFGRPIFGSVAAITGATMTVNAWSGAIRLNSAMLGYSTASQFAGGITFIHAEKPEPKIEAQLSLTSGATSAVFLGHNRHMAGIGGGAGGPRWLGVCWISPPLQGSVPSALACTALPTGLTVNTLAYHRIGSTIYAHSRGELSNVPFVASVSAVIPVYYLTVEGAQAVLLGVGGQFGPRISSINVEDSPSSGLAPRNIYSFTASDAVRMDAASVVTQEISGYQRGALPKLTPSAHQKVVGFAIPLDGGKTNDMISLDVRIRERFIYAR